MAVNLTDIIAIPISQASINRAAYTAGKKFANTVQGFQSRQPIQILDDTFRGDLAKLALIEYLGNNGVNNIEDYDRVRTDNFMDPNSREWHFRTERYRVEVNSSNKTARFNTPALILNNLDIKINAGDGNNIVFPLDHTYDIAVQVYYYEVPLRPRFYTKQQILQNLNVSDNQISNEVIRMLDLYTRFENSNIYGYAWNYILEVENIRVANERALNSTTWTFNGANRNYWKCPIVDSNPIANLIGVL